MSETITMEWTPTVTTLPRGHLMRTDTAGSVWIRLRKLPPPEGPRLAGFVTEAVPDGWRTKQALVVHDKDDPSFIWVPAEPWPVPR